MLRDGSAHKNHHLRLWQILLQKSFRGSERKFLEPRCALRAATRGTIAAIVSARRPGKGTWQLLPRMDHGFALHESLKESVAHEFVGPFGEQVVQETLRWIQVQ